MNTEIISILVNAIVTLAGVFGGILTANKLTNFRIEALEKKVEQHNNTITRTYILEQKVEDMDKDIEELKQKHKG